MQCQGCFSGGFGSEYFYNPATGQSSDTQRFVKGQGTGRDYRYLHYRPAPQFHDGTFAELAFNLSHGSVHGFLFIC